jgi:hypothetical protein
LLSGEREAERAQEREALLVVPAVVVIATSRPRTAGIES